MSLFCNCNFRHREGERFGIPVRYCRSQAEVQPGITITNYDCLEAFDAGAFTGVVLDESSILKSFTGATTRALIQAFASTPFRLAATATPAPNDHMEIGQHAEFLGVMASNEMLARWFTSDQTEMGRYRLKRHGETLNVELASALAHDPRGIPVPVSRADASLQEVLASAPKVQNRVPEGATWDGKSDLPPDEASFREMLSDRDPQAAPLRTPAVPVAPVKTGT